MFPLRLGRDDATTCMIRFTPYSSGCPGCAARMSRLAGAPSRSPAHPHADSAARIGGGTGAMMRIGGRFL